MTILAARANTRVHVNLLDPSAQKRYWENTPGLLTLITDAMPNLLFVKDTDSRFLFVNKRLAALFNSTQSQMIGKTDADFIADARQVAHFRNHDRQVFLTGKPLKISEELLNDAAGTTHRLATVKVPLLLPDNRLCLLGVATDITEIPRDASAREMRFSIMGDLAHLLKLAY